MLRGQFGANPKLRQTCIFTAKPEDTKILGNWARNTNPPDQYRWNLLALSDIGTLEEGPTQYVRGSHYSGRGPNSQENPEFEGNKPESIYCKAGNIYLQDPQCWHRGAPNTSNKTRYIIQSQYAAYWAYWRFSLCNGVPVPDDALRSADDRLLSLLGVHRPEA